MDKIIFNTTINILNNSLSNSTTIEDGICNSIKFYKLHGLKNNTEKCYLETDNCSDNPFINFYQLHFCFFEGNIFYTGLVFMLVLLLSFYILTDTANKYLEPALTILSEKFNLSDSIAAMTFLSFGNGAPDVITSVVAANKSSTPQGLELSISALLGAAMTITSFVMSTVIYLGGGKTNIIQVSPKMYTREILFFLIVLLFIGLISLKGTLNLIESCLFFSLFFVNLFIAVYLDKKETKRKREKEVENEVKSVNYNQLDETNNSVKDSKDISDINSNFHKVNYNELELSYNKLDELNSTYSQKKTSSGLIRNEISKKENNNTQYTSQINVKIENTNTTKSESFNSNYSSETNLEAIAENVVDFIDNYDEKKDKYYFSNEKSEKKNQEILSKGKKEEIKNNNELNNIAFCNNNNERVVVIEKESNCEVENKTKKKKKKSFKLFKKLLVRVKTHYFTHHSLNFKDSNYFLKAIYILFQFPLSIFRDLSIPTVQQERYNKFTFACFPIFSTLIIVTFMDKWAEFLYLRNELIFLSITSLLLLSFVIFACSRENISEKLIIPISLVSFVMSILWIWIGSDLLMEALDFLGYFFSLSKSFLCLTLLALGNSAADYFLDVALANTGFAEMALSGTISAPLFNLVFGLGSSLIMMNLKFGVISFDFMKNRNVPTIVAYFFLIINLVTILIIGIKSGFKFRKLHALIIFLQFFVYIIVLVVLFFF